MKHIRVGFIYLFILENNEPGWAAEWATRWVPAVPASEVLEVLGTKGTPRVEEAEVPSQAAKACEVRVCVCTCARARVFI